MPQTHIPVKHRKNPQLCDQLYGRHWRKPKLLCDVEALEMLYDPPDRILHYSDFRPYQRWMSRQIMRLPAVFLAAAMGLGKTGASLHAAVQLLDAGVVTKILIVAPLAVCENTWPDEIATWGFARHLEYSVVTGDEDERIAALRADADVYIINRENLPWLQKYALGRAWIWDMLIYDEASRLKSADKKTESKRISEFGVLSRMQFKFKKIVMLSGTPAPNGLIDLWGPIYICDKGLRLGTSITAFRNRWFRKDEFRRTYEPFDHSHDEIMGKIKDIFFSLREEDYLTLPPLLEREHAVDLPPKALELYRRLERDSVIAELKVEAVNNGVLTNKLLQLANGSLYDTEQTATHVHDAKIDALDSIVKEAMGQPILLGYSYKFDVERIKKKYPWARVFGDGKNDLRDWNAGKIRMMIMHPASGGHGMNFQHGGNIAVWYGLTWSLELYEQFKKRLHRSGQKGEHVLLHHILAKKTVDFNVMKAIKKKGVRQDDITEVVRQRLVDIQRQEEWKRAA